MGRQTTSWHAAVPGCDRQSDHGCDNSRERLHSGPQAWGRGYTGRSEVYGVGPVPDMTLEQLAEYAAARGAALGDNPVGTLHEYMGAGLLRPKPGQGRGRELFDESHLAVIWLVDGDLAAGYTLEQIRDRMASNVYLSEQGLAFIRKHRSPTVPGDAFVPGRALTRAEMAVISMTLLDAGLDASEARRMLESMFVLETGEPAFHRRAGHGEGDA